MLMENKNHYWVYIHTNLKNGKVYIGTTQRERPEIRWRNGGSAYKNNPHFWNAIQKYGWDEGFSHEAWEVNSAEEMYAEEQRLIALYDSANFDKGYNRSAGGELSHYGCTASEESRKKMSLFQSTREHGACSEETKKKISEANKGKHLSEDTKKKLSDTNKGKSPSDVTKKKISKGRAHKHRAIGLDGIVHMYTSQEIEELGLLPAPPTKAKGASRPAEWGRKISTSKMGHAVSEEQKQKQRNKMKGSIPWNKGKKVPDDKRLHWKKGADGKRIYYK